MLISKRLKQFCAGTPQRQQWLQELPGVVDRLVTDWSISLDRVFESSDSHCSFVASAIRSNQHHVVLKIGVPHFEGEQEIAGLLFWDGEPTVYLLEADASVNAMLLERCVPGTTLKTLPATDQDHVMADMLTRLWRRPEGSHSFRHITEMVRYWREETLLNQAAWPDQDLVEHGLQVLDEMAQPSGRDVLLATDLHAGNVLRSQRKPWLAIDPKPFIGDPAYDATQHLFNRGIQTHARPKDLISDLAGLLGIAAHRIQSWMFARAAAEPRDLWFADAVALARRLSP